MQTLIINRWALLSNDKEFIVENSVPQQFISNIDTIKETKTIVVISDSQFNREVYYSKISPEKIIRKCGIDSGCYLIINNYKDSL